MGSTPTPYLTTLTPLRGIAAMLIVIFHCNLMYEPFIPDGITEFFNNCWLWVDFFFVLSGFIMCYVYHSYFEGGVTRLNFTKFMGARFARIYPLYFITTIWAFLVAVIITRISSPMHPFFVQVFDPWTLPSCLLLIQSMHIGYITAPLNTPSWSLSTEWWAYVVFPFVLPLFMTIKARGRILAAGVIIGFFVLIRYGLGPISYDSSGPTLNMLTDFGFLRCLAGFFAGMWIYALYRNKSGYRWLKSDWFFAASFLGTIAAMHFGLMDIVIVGFFPLIIISAAYNDTLVKRILSTKVLQRLGDWSYAIYMVHVPFILMLIIYKVQDDPGYFSDFAKFLSHKPGIHGLYMCLFIVTVTLILSALVYRFVEVPSRKYLNGFFRTKERKVIA